MRTTTTPELPLPGPGRDGSRVWATLDAFIEGGPALGRKVANSTFLGALFQLDPYDSYHFFLGSHQEGESLRRWLWDKFPGLARRGAVCVGSRAMLQESLSQTRYHCFHLSDVVTRFVQLAQLRNAVAANIFPITGVTHSLSYARFMPEYLKHLWPGASPRDALMVTSESVRLVMGRVFDGLRHEYGLDEGLFPEPRLELIPLGVDTAGLPGPGERWDSMPAPGRHEPAAPEGPVERGRAAKEMRARLGLEREVVFLCLGRISPYSKMDIMPVLLAFRRAEKLGLPKGGYALVLAGWPDEGEDLPEALRGYAQAMGIRLIPLARPTDGERRALYAAADVFLSPSDNIQESFGLTVAEAGAAMLPVIASDFDGYRDIVVHGETGLLVPTLGFADTAETDVQAAFWFENQYHLKLSQSCAVHVPALAGALARLGTDKELRARMGEAGRRRVLERFSWDTVIERYVAFWDELAAVPLSGEQERRFRAARHPQIMRFGEYFRGHFSGVPDAGRLAGITVKRTAAGDALYRGVLPVMHYAGMEHILDQEAVRRMLLAARKPVAAASLVEMLREFFQDKTTPEFAMERASFTLIWALKQDYLECVEQDRDT